MLRDDNRVLEKSEGLCTMSAGLTTLCIYTISLVKEKGLPRTCSNTTSSDHLEAYVIHLR